MTGLVTERICPTCHEPRNFHHTGWCEEHKKLADKKPTLAGKLKAAGVTRQEMRDHLRCNLFDGNEDGLTTMRVKTLLDEINNILFGEEE